MKKVSKKINVTGVRFKPVGKIYYFDKKGLNVEEEMGVIVETARGLEYGTVIIVDKEVSEKELTLPLKPIIRIATPKDEEQVKENKIKEKDAYDICLDKVKEHSLPMKLLNVEYTFDRGKIIFYFTADGRVDFRELVKDLASIFRTRIELRQVGVRDEAKTMCGLGTCGRELCCCSFLEEFEVVSIKMAKNQGISLNPGKISGTCGRLMCCLKYEDEAYKDLRARFPKEGDFVKTPNGRGKVKENYFFKNSVLIQFEEGGFEKFTLDEIQFKPAGKGAVIEVAPEEVEILEEELLIDEDLGGN